MLGCARLKFCRLATQWNTIFPSHTNIYPFVPTKSTYHNRGILHSVVLTICDACGAQCWPPLVGLPATLFQRLGEFLEVHRDVWRNPYMYSYHGYHAICWILNLGNDCIQWVDDRMNSQGKSTVCIMFFVMGAPVRVLPGMIGVSHHEVQYQLRNAYLRLPMQLHREPLRHAQYLWHTHVNMFARARAPEAALPAADCIDTPLPVRILHL